jgi:fatty-acyl-CoA synthase
MSTAERPWVEGLTFERVLTRTVERFGDHDALVFPQLRYRRNYVQFQADVREIACALLALGVKRGEHLGIWATNWPEWVVTQFAAAHVGAVLVNINPAYRAHELEYVLNQADITTLLLTDRFKNSDFFDILAGVCPELATCPPGELRSSLVSSRTSGPAC